MGDYFNKTKLNGLVYAEPVPFASLCGVQLYQAFLKVRMHPEYEATDILPVLLSDGEFTKLDKFVRNKFVHTYGTIGRVKDATNKLSLCAFLSGVEYVESGKEKHVNDVKANGELVANPFYLKNQHNSQCCRLMVETDKVQGVLVPSFVIGDSVKRCRNFRAGDFVKVRGRYTSCREANGNIKYDVRANYIALQYKE